jgi:hypothetical protein
VVPLRIEHGAEHLVQPLQEEDPDYQRVLEDAGMAPQLGQRPTARWH